MVGQLQNAFMLIRMIFIQLINVFCKITPVKANGKLLFYLLNRNQFFLAFDDGVKQTNLRNEDVLNCPIILPKNPNEQQKIATCLSSFDEVIAAHSQKLIVLKDHKKRVNAKPFPTRRRNCS